MACALRKGLAPARGVVALCAQLQNVALAAEAMRWRQITLKRMRLLLLVMLLLNA